MSSRELHDLLSQLEHQRSNLDQVDHEQHRRIDELITSLERQLVEPVDAEENAAISTRVTELVTEYESDHPTMAAVLNGIGRVLQNFRA